MGTSELQLTQSSVTLERIQQIVRDLLGNDEITLTPDTAPADVDGWDSLANVSIIFGLEEEFGISLGDAVMAGFSTVGELAALVDSASHGT